MKKTAVNTSIRLLISFAILWFLISKIEFSKLKGTMSNFNPLLYISAILLLFIHQYIWATMWRITLLEKNIKVKPGEIYRAVLTSYFFGTLLPSSIGPDIVLTYNIGKTLQEKHHAPSSLLFIRLMNMTGILFVSGIVLMFLSKTFFLRQILILTWLLLLLIWIAYWLAVHPGSREKLERVVKKYPFLGFIYKIFHSFSTFGLDKKVTLKIWLLGIAMTFLKVVFDYIIARSLGLHIPYIWFLGLVPSASIISLLPVTIAGLGLREGAYVVLFSNMGIAPANSFSISLLVFTLNIWLCITGGILYLIHGAHVKSKSL